MTGENPTGIHDSPDNRILLVVHDALYKIAPLGAAIGDIVLTTHSFYFLRYDNFVYSRTFAKIAGVLAGVDAGSVAASEGEKNSLANAHQNPPRSQSNLYGFRLSERLGNHADSLVLPSERIKELKASGASVVSLTDLDGKRYDFFCPPLGADVQNLINRWPASEGQYDSSGDPEGFLVGSASLRELLRRLRGGDSSAAAEIYRLGQDERYAATLYAEIQAKEEPERLDLWRSLAPGPQDFRNPLMAVADQELRGIIGQIIKMVFAIVVILMTALIAGILAAFGFFHWLASSVSYGSAFKSWCLFLGGLAILALFGLGIFLLDGRNRIWRTKDVKICLQREV